MKFDSETGERLLLLVRTYQQKKAEHDRRWKDHRPHGEENFIYNREISELCSHNSQIHQAAKDFTAATDRLRSTQQ